MYNEAEINSIKEALIQSKQSIAAAESVTAGHIQAALSSAEMASQFFQGGITAYNLGQKTRHLNIDPVKAIPNDCVSQEISIEMAREVCRMFCCDWGIGITGYATPMPEQNVDRPFAFFAIAHKNEIVVSRKIFAAQQNAVEVQIFYTDSVITALHDALVLQQQQDNKTSAIKPAAPAA